MATQYSTQYTLIQDEPTQQVISSDWGSKLYVSHAVFVPTVAIPADDVIKMIKLPAGKVRVYSDLSYVVCPAGTATANLSVGYAAYTGGDGDPVVADPNAFADALDVGGGAIGEVFPLPAAAAGRFLLLDSLSGVDIELLFDTEAGPAAGNVFLRVVYSRG